MNLPCYVFLEKSMIIGIIRVFLTCVCLWYVFHETGGVTTFLFGLMALTNEAMAFWMRETQKVLNKLVEQNADNRVNALHT